MKYVTTKKQCQSTIDKFHNVCERCGRKLVPIKTVDNANNPTYWSGCYHNKLFGDWGHFTGGVKIEIYKLAYKITLDDSLYFTSSKDKIEDFNYWFAENMDKICGMLISINYLKENKPRNTKTELRKQFKQYRSFSK